jgi:hypothetical protein
VEQGPPKEKEVGVKEMFASVVSMVQNLSIQISSVQQGLNNQISMATSQLSDQMATITLTLERLDPPSYLERLKRSF